MRLTVPGWGRMGTAAFALVAASSCYAQAAQPAPAPPPVAASSVSSEVAAFYDSFTVPQIWFRNGVEDPAVPQLVAILQRAPFDGFAEGPQLAAQVQAAAAQARVGGAPAATAAERILSSAWVRYVQSLKRATPGMIYAYPVLKPQGTKAEEILLTAAAAPSLGNFLIKTSHVNPLYAQLRDAAWVQAQATGTLVPDPRLLANLDRIRSIPASGKFVIVDSGSQMLTMFENGQPVDSMKVVVGKSELPTPLIASIMHYIVFNPYWNVPDHLVRKVTAPNVLRLGAAYIKRQGYEVMADWTAEAAVIPWQEVDWKSVEAGATHIRVRQLPGTANSMGKLKFPFPSGEDIYLHDTPEREYFARDQRTLSNGCVRLEDAQRLGRWLLGQDPVAPADGPEIQVQLPTGIPIFLTYITARVADGQLTYLDDPYGWDQPAKSQVASTQ